MSMAHTGDHGETENDEGGEQAIMKTLVRRTAALLVATGLAVGISGMATPANATDDTSWGRIVATDTVID